MYMISHKSLKGSLAAFRLQARLSARRPFSQSALMFNAKDSAGEETKPTDGEEAGAADPVEELKAKLAKKEKEYVELKDAYVRSKADFINLQETTKREIQKARDFALQKFAKDLIESIDNFGHALGAVKEDSIKTNDEIKLLYDGVKLTRDVFEKTLHRHGLAKIDPIDEEFDPNRHEATFQAPHEEKKPGTVFYVQQPGYELNGRVLRPAKVGIVKGDD